MAAESPRTPPAELISTTVDRVLQLAATWPQWDGTPLAVEVEGEDQPRLYTPHKAIRRVADHLLDHLAEIEARVAGRPTHPDAWHGSLVTTPGDLAPFTDVDVDEAGSRLRRIGQLWQIRLAALPDELLDAPSGDQWTLRQVTEHVAESVFYAESVGDLRR
jgi:hypothetical protein